MHEGIKAIKRLSEKHNTEQMSSQKYRETVIARLREAVPFAAACCTVVDPYTLLSTGAVTEQGVENIHSKLFEHEYLQDDYNKYDELAQARVPVATLSAATGGQLERSSRYREALQPAGFGDELRAALQSEGACWGYLTLFRSQDSAMFQEEERALVASVTPEIGAMLRSYTLQLAAVKRSAQEEEHGIMVLSEQLIPLTFNAVARKWLSRLREMEQLGDDTLPNPVRAVCSRALADRQSGNAATSRAKISLRLAQGNFLTIMASLLEGPAGLTQLAVLFVPAKSSDILPIIAEAYALSVRELQIVEHIAKGLSTKELAEVLHISRYTVQDHLKSIFAKTGVTSRRELNWTLFSQYNLD
ncbi:helix-turn-helix transcriptional regulator [Paenibacillus albidus]|uniref:Helix-turn-helix transcriptional regulator n=1 Tax=Paenibacillus albidus TaxID=2041023 RepID=A0A917FES3_9BACL|nr:helix-turn-helix transcriptional regulator [Paenibacillus albidus]GGF68704.1 helix-turn-helix transcriptional regulator [Paenibacillus albidus]